MNYGERHPRRTDRRRRTAVHRHASSTDARTTTDHGNYGRTCGPNHFYRFITPMQAEDRPGRWQRHFDKWKCTVRDVLPTSELELIPELKRFVPPARVLDKPAIPPSL